MQDGSKKPSALSHGLPGADLVQKGLEDLGRGVESMEALLVSIGRPRLLRLGFDVARRYDRPEHRLYELLAADRRSLRLATLYRRCQPATGARS
jgi:hypothetical protein